MINLLSEAPALPVKKEYKPVKKGFTIPKPDSTPSPRPKQSAHSFLHSSQPVPKKTAMQPTRHSSEVRRPEKTQPRITSEFHKLQSSRPVVPNKPSPPSKTVTTSIAKPGQRVREMQLKQEERLRAQLMVSWIHQCLWSRLKLELSGNLVLLYRLHKLFKFQEKFHWNLLKFPK